MIAQSMNRPVNDIRGQVIITRNVEHIFQFGFRAPAGCFFGRSSEAAAAAATAAGAQTLAESGAATWRRAGWLAGWLAGWRPRGGSGRPAGRNGTARACGQSSRLEVQPGSKSGALGRARQAGGARTEAAIAAATWT